jgi:hypothetical protein
MTKLNKMALACIATGALVFGAGNALAQISYDQYGNRDDDYRGTITPNPAFAPPPPFYVPSLPQIPDVSGGVGDGGEPYGSSSASEPTYLPCTMPGCR